MEKNEKTISKLIKRYPFNGRSNYLIDKFYIIGYNIPTLLKLLFEENNDNLSKYILIEKKQNDEDKGKSSLNVQAFTLQEEPILLNEFSSDFNKESFDFNMFKDMIIPNKILLYYSEEELSSFQKENSLEFENENDEFSQYEENDYFDNDLLKERAVVISSNPVIGTTSKKSINGLGYIFYKQLKKRKILSKKVITFYIPIIFSIISEFPFYSSFEKLCKQIKQLYSYQKKEVPIEIMLSNIINFTQSPISGNVTISIRPFSFLNKSLSNNINLSSSNEKKTKKFINAIKEVINEDDETKEFSENNVGRKRTNDDIINNFSHNSNINIRGNINKNFLKKNSQFINESENRAGHSPITPRKDNDKIITQRRKRKTYTQQNINSFIEKAKKKQKNKKNKLKNDNDNYLTEELFPKIKFEILRGYPLIQYNLAKVLLYKLTPSDIIDIFFYTFLEKDIIFFSKNLLYLSLTINSYLNLNFPLNDGTYYFNNASVSFDNYINNNSTFVGSTYTTIIGINDQYNSKYQNSSTKIKEHLVVDLDKGEVRKVEDKKNKKGSKMNTEFFNFIKKTCKKELKNDKKETIISKEVYILYKKLNEINSLLNNNENENDKNEQYKLFKNGDFLDYDDGKNNYIKKTNLEIQNSFYRLINNLCLYFYQNLSIKTEDDDLKKRKEIKRRDGKKIDKTEMNVIFRDDYKNEGESDYIKEELFFLDELRETTKFQSFVYSFVQSYSPIDLYKIPLTFTEEFLSIISRKRSILDNNVDFFQIIDQLYGSQTFQNVDIDFYPYFKIYYENYQNYFDREIIDFYDENILNEDLIKIKYCLDENSYKKYLKYRDYELDNNLLMDYLNIINNLNENEKNYIVYYSEVLKKNIPKEILVIDVENLIENYSIETNLLSRSDLCCSNIILLFSLSLNFLDSNMGYQSFLSFLFQEFTVFRKYYSYIMNMIYILFSNSLNKENYSRANFYLLCYYICVNSIRNLKLVPNEGLMNILKKFNEIDLKKFDENLVKHQKGQKEEEISSNIINDDKSKPFIKEELTEKNLFTCYNCTKKSFIKESEIIDKINGVINNDFSICIDGELYQPKIKYNNNIFKIDSYFYSQTSLLTQLINAYNKFIVDLNEAHLAYKLLVDSCINILVFMRNSNDFKDKSEIKDTIETIFFLFLNKIVQANNNILNKNK